MTFPVLPPASLPVLAEPARLPGSASVGNVPGHLSSPPSASELVTDSPWHITTSVPKQGRRGSPGPCGQVEGCLGQDCGHYKDDTAPLSLLVLNEQRTISGLEGP